MYTIRPYSQYSSRRTIEKSLGKLLKKANLQEGALNVESITDILKQGDISITDEQATEILSKMSGLDVESEIEKLTKTLGDALDKYPRIKSFILEKLPDLKEYLNEAAEPPSSEIIKENYIKESLFIKESGLTLSSLTLMWKTAKMAWETVVYTFKYLFDNEVPLWKKAFILTLAGLAGTGYIFIPEPTDFLIPLFGIGLIDEVLAYFISFRVIARIVDSENWKRISGASSTEVEGDDQKQLEEGRIIDIEESDEDFPKERAWTREEARNRLDEYMKERGYGSEEQDDKEAGNNLSRDLVKIANLLDIKGYTSISNIADNILLEINK